MASKKNTRRALFMSVMSLILCCAMLMGTTFAWFTDEVKSGVNQINAGNLDVELFYGKDTNPTEKVDNTDKLFTAPDGKTDIVWEPGAVAYTNLKVDNVGTLALKYQMAMNFSNMNYVEYADGSRHDLTEVLKVAVVDGGFKGGRDAVADLSYDYTLSTFSLSGVLEGDTESKTYGVVIYWEPGTNEHDNLYNMNNGKTTSDGKALRVDLGVNLYATQEMYENDSFGSDYDPNAWVDAMVVLNEADLNAAIANGEKAKLEADITLTASLEIPANSEAAINLNGHTVSGAFHKDVGHVIRNNGSLTLVGGTVESTADNGGSAIYNAAGASLTLDDVTLYGAPRSGSSWPSYAINNYGNLTIYSADITSYHGALSLYGDTVIHDANVTMNGFGGSSHVFYIGGEGTDVTVHGGTYTHKGNGDGSLAYIMTGTTMTINGGTFSAVNSGYGLATYTGSLIVNGGTFANAFLDWGGPITISGGTFAKKPADEYIAEGYAAVENGNGNWVVKPEGTVFVADGLYKNDNTYYVENANGLNHLGTMGNLPSATIVLENSIDMSSYTMKPIVLAGNSTVIFNGNGHTISNLTLTSALANGMTGEGNEVAGLFDMTENSGCTLNVDNLTLTDVTISNSGFAAAIVGYANSSNDDITLNDVNVNGATITSDSVAALVGYTVGPVELTNCDVSGLNLTGEEGRPEKVGAFIGTANQSSCVVNTNDCTNNTSYSPAGRVINGATMTIGGVVYVTNADSLAAAVANGATNILLADGEYDVYGCGGKTLTLSGSKNAVLKVMNEGENGCDYGFGDSTGVSNITFNGLTIDTTANTGNYKGYAYMKGTFNDCNFVGAYSLNNANDFVFNRCTFDFKNGYFWTWGANSVTFDGCTFNGNSKTILAHGGTSTVININNCTFAATEKGYTSAGDNTAVVEMDPIGANTYTINFSGENTKTEHYADWTRVKDESTGHIITGLN